jgi:hypothetical protein
VNEVMEIEDPKWVIIGSKTNRGVRVIASTSLTEAQLTARADVRQVVGEVARLPLMSVRYVLAADFSSFVIVEARTFTSAMATLATKWDPDAAVGRTGEEYDRRALTW